MKELIRFTEAEFQSRINNCCENIERAGMPGMMISAEANINYYSGYRTHTPWTTFTRPMSLFIPVQGEPLLYAQTFVTPKITLKPCCCDNRNFDNPPGSAANELYDTMWELNMVLGSVDLELGLEQRINYQSDTFLALWELIGAEDIIDVAPLIQWQRITKSPAEIACHRIACEATGYTHNKALAAIEVGMSEREISMLAQQFMLGGGAEYPGFVIITSGSGNYEWISAISSERRLKHEDMLWLDSGAVYNDHWSDFCRAGVVGPISDEHNRIQDGVHAITEEAASVMAPGVPIAQVARACGEVLEKRGYQVIYDCGRMGHGMGLMSTEPISVTVHEEGVLQEGIIINLEPGILVESGVSCIEKNYVITADGYERPSIDSRKLHQTKA